MSTRCAFMSSRPSSNTANRPHGPAPMISTSVLMGAEPVVSNITLSSSLITRRTHDQTVQFFRHLDLARQPRIRPHVESRVELVGLFVRRRADLLDPGVVHIDMASRARARAAAFCHDRGHPVLE